MALSFFFHRFGCLGFWDYFCLRQYEKLPVWNTDMFELQVVKQNNDSKNVIIEHGLKPYFLNSKLLNFDKTYNHLVNVTSPGSICTREKRSRYYLSQWNSKLLR